MKDKLYRTVSHWIEFEDFDYPGSYVEDKIQKKALAAKNAGVNGVILFGMHLRWDFIVCFETVTSLIKYIAEAYHQYGITVMDHHSAVGTHRPPDMAGRWNTYKHNHHHLAITLDKTIIGQLHYAGSPINSLRQKRVDNNEPVFVPAYQIEMYCINNPAFQKAYITYISNLVREAKLDGVMSDDIVHYGQWCGCGCSHCREKFKKLYGHALPDASDMTFWGNYDNPAWRDSCRAIMDGLDSHAARHPGLYSAPLKI